MTLRTYCLIALTAVSMLTGSAQAAPFWTVSLHGHITDGIDTTGVFGVANMNLAGMEYTQKITSSVDPENYQYATLGKYYSQLEGIYSKAPVFDNVTVNGVTVSFSIMSPYTSTQAIMAGLSLGGPWPEYGDAIATILQGDSGFGYVRAILDAHTVRKDLAFVPSVEFSQNFEAELNGDVTSFDLWNERVGYSFFEISGLQKASFNAFADRLTVENIDLPYETQPAIVPEPGSLALIGFALVGLILRRPRS